MISYAFPHLHTMSAVKIHLDSVVCCVYSFALEEKGWLALKKNSSDPIVTRHCLDQLCYGLSKLQQDFSRSPGCNKLETVAKGGDNLIALVLKKSASNRETSQGNCRGRGVQRTAWGTVLGLQLWEK